MNHHYLKSSSSGGWGSVVADCVAVGGVVVAVGVVVVAVFVFAVVVFVVCVCVCLCVGLISTPAAAFVPRPQIQQKMRLASS